MRNADYGARDIFRYKVEYILDDMIQKKLREAYKNIPQPKELHKIITVDICDKSYYVDCDFSSHPYLKFERLNEVLPSDRIKI